MGRYNEEQLLIMFYDRKLDRFVDRTKKIQWYKKDSNAYRIKFYNNDKFYHKPLREIQVFENPKEIPFTDGMYINKHKLTNCRKILRFDNWVKIFYYHQESQVFPMSQLSTHKHLIDQGPNDVFKFNYFKELAMSHGEDYNFLASMYEKLGYKREKNILTKYLNLEKIKSIYSNNDFIYPFGLNLSQKEAVENAFSKNISVIEGPPGTGKTQTILNIIANAVLLNKSVAVVSNNNAAIENIKDKLAAYNLDSLVALLGNKENKNVFFEKTIQQEKTFGKRERSESNYKLKQMVSHYQQALPNMYNKENRLAELKEQLRIYELEYTYYKKQTKIVPLKKKIIKKINKSSMALYWKALLEDITSLSLIQKIRFRFLFKNKATKYSNDTIKSMIQGIENLYYTLKIKEINQEIKQIEKFLAKENFQEAKKNFEEISLEVLKRGLTYKYRLIDKIEYTYKNYKNYFSEFIKEYPVILSTSYALMPSADDNFLFDYLIIDEASQTDLISSVLAMSCAKNLVVVGDTKQLPQIPLKGIEKLNKVLKEKYYISDGYDYLTNNILTSILTIYPNISKVLLKEHYRCHPDIINFCNQKFYNNELIVMTSSNTNNTPLSIIKTVPGNHARKNPNGTGLYNQREIDEIKNLIKEIDEDSIGVITPFRYQANLINQSIMNMHPHIEVDTVHKFQGRAKDHIVLSTVANDISSNHTIDNHEDFIARSDLLNVAVSRAKKKLTLVVSDKIFYSKNNTIAELVKYIRYHTPSSQIVEGEVTSIFDILYADYQETLMAFRKKQYKKMVITEQIFLNTIKEVIKPYHLDVIMHYPLRVIIKDLSQLNDDEIKYVTHHWSHVDFTIINKLTKEIVLVIETDGVSYHEQNKKQNDRDIIKDKALKLNRIPLLRLKTNESNEKERVHEKLKEILNYK